MYLLKKTLTVFFTIREHLSYLRCILGVDVTAQEQKTCEDGQTFFHVFQWTAGIKVFVWSVWFVLCPANGSCSVVVVCTV